MHYSKNFNLKKNSQYESTQLHKLNSVKENDYILIIDDTVTSICYFY